MLTSEIIFPSLNGHTCFKQEFLKITEDAFFPLKLQYM